MITPTKTVCYAKYEGKGTWHKVAYSNSEGVDLEFPSRSNKVWPYRLFSKFVVREEPISLEDLRDDVKGIEQAWHGGVVKSACSKTFFPDSPCFCEKCNTALISNNPTVSKRLLRLLTL